jgi:hypothetical protein
LPEIAIAQFSYFFKERLLQEVRLVEVPALQNFGFLEPYHQSFAEKDIPLLDFTAMAGITFVDTILLVDRFLTESSVGLILHELEHAVQYNFLGPDKFVELYLLGWFNQGFNYPAIPLRIDTYELQNRYEADPTDPSPVKDEVSRRLELMVED